MRASDGEGYVCEEHGCTVDAKRYVVIAINDDGSDDVHWLCDDHAPKFGFCLYCGYFVLGSGDDSKLARTGLCDECIYVVESESADYYDPDLDFGW